MRASLVTCSLFATALACASPARAQIIVTVAGGGDGDGLPARAVAIRSPTAVAIDQNGGLLIADSKACLVWRVDRRTDRIHIVAGTGHCRSSGDGGPARQAELNGPSGLAVDRQGHVFVAETDGHRIRRVDRHTGLIDTVAGTGEAGFDGDGGDARQASLDAPVGLALDSQGTLYIADSENNRIRRLRHGRIDTVLGPSVAGLGVALSMPSAVLLDGQGRSYIADTGNGRVLVSEPGFVRSRIIAKGDEDAYAIFDNAPPLKSAMREPTSLALGAEGDLYVVDTERSCVWRLDRLGRLRVAVGHRSSAQGDPGYGGDGGAAQDSQLDEPHGVALAANGDLYVADTENARVRRIAAKTGIITTVAGNGTSALTGDGQVATRAALSAPAALAVDRAGALYIADAGNGSLRKVDPIDGTILQIVGADTDRWGGFGHNQLSSTRAGLAFPGGVAIDRFGNVYVADSRGDRILRLDASSATLNTVAGGRRVSSGFGGDGGPARVARMQEPHGLAIGPDGSLYIADLFNGRVRRIDQATGIISSVAGDGPHSITAPSGTKTTFGSFNAVVLDATGNIYIADIREHRIHRVDARTGLVTTMAGNGVRGSERDGTFSGDGGPATLAGLNRPSGVAVDVENNVYVADTANNRIRRIDAKTGIISTVVGSGVAGFSGDRGRPTDAQLNQPSALAVAPDGTLYIADSANDRVRAVLFKPDPATPFLRRVAGRPAAQADISGDFAAAERTCDLLTRHLPTLNREGDLRLHLREAEYVSAALVELQGSEAVRQVRAARCLRILLSPWARSEFEGTRYGRYTRIQRMRRPSERPLSDPSAPIVRKTALELFTRLVRAKPLTPRDREDDVFSATLELVAEVGDDETARALESLIGPRSIGVDAIMNAIARIHGFPERWSGGFLDDNPGGPEELARFEAAEAVKRQARVTEFHAWHANILRMTQSARLRAALRQWEAHLQWGAESSSRFADELTGVIRLGQPVVPLLRELAEHTPDNNTRAGAYIAIAAITGQVDFDMVSQLLDGDNEEVSIGAAMIEGSGSRAFREKLVDVLNRRDAAFSAAAHALVTCHLQEALMPLLAFEGDKSLTQFELMELKAGLEAGEW